MTNTDPLYEAMKAAMLACPAGCSCRGTYTGPERRSVHRDSYAITEVRSFARAEVEAFFPQDGTWTEPPDVERDAAEGRAFYSWDRP